MQCVGAVPQGLQMRDLTQHISQFTLDHRALGRRGAFDQPFDLADVLREPIDQFVKIINVITHIQHSV